eukprot:COSAG02_NODE_880_length_16242_cov_5.512946_7_plen_138_part_00
MEGRRHQSPGNACTGHVSVRLVNAYVLDFYLHRMAQAYGPTGSSNSTNTKMYGCVVTCFSVCTGLWHQTNRIRRVVMAAALAMLSWSYWYYEEKPPPVFAISGMAVISGAYSFSYGPLNWLITAELFTVGVRGIAHM